MICEKCKEKMQWIIEGSTQGWKCPACGWNIITTHVDDMIADMTEYSIYIKSVQEIDKEKIKFVSKIANVSFVVAKKMLQEGDVCILKAKASRIKEVVINLRELKIDFKISPEFRY